MPQIQLTSRRGFNSLFSSLLRNSSTTKGKLYPDVDFRSFEQPAKFESTYPNIRRSSVY